MSARLNMVEQAANQLLWASANSSIPSPKVGQQWSKQWIDRQPDLSKVKKKPLAAARKNAHDPNLLMGYFRKYKEVIDKYEIQPAD